MIVTPALLSLLSRPPSFIPTPVSCPHSAVFFRVRDFVRRLQWHGVFVGRPTSNARPCRFGTFSSSAWPPAGLVSPRLRLLSRRILNAARSILSSDHTCYHHQNLPADERAALVTLKSDPNTITRPADKGGRWVIMDANAYSTECARQLNDPVFYRRLDSPIPLSSVDPRSLLLDLQLDGFISKKEFAFLMPPVTPKPRRFGILPKAHKLNWTQADMPAGRPIIADVNTINSGVARLVDFFLKPLAQLLDSFLLDSQHLLAVLRSERLLPGSILATLDVRSLYTNVPIEEGLKRVQRAFNAHPDPNRPDQHLLRLLGSSLTHNDFSFEQNTWLQVKGVAMGKAFGGNFASLYLGEWETNALQSAPLRPRFWKRFLDDILLVWDHGIDAFADFVRHLNDQDPNIQLEATSDPNSIRFLDLELYRMPDDSIGHRIGFKDTDSHSLLPSDSHHASHVHRGVLFSQILRWATRSATYEDFLGTCHTVFPYWRLQGASRALLRSCVRRVFTLTNLRPSWSFGFRRCAGVRCSACSHASPCAVFKDTLSSRLYPILANFSCDTTHCIYVLYCSACFKHYVGQTSNAVRTRICEHFRAVTRGSPMSHIVHHFNNECTPHSFRWFVIDRSFSRDRRLQKEAHWIRTLKTQHPLGLNDELGHTDQKLNLVTFPAACTARLNSYIREACRKQAGLQVRFCYKKDANLASLLK